MKKIISIILMAIIVLACQKNHTVVVSGKISNPVDESVIIRNNYYDKIDTIKVNSDGTFIAEIDLDDEHLGEIYYQNHLFAVYLEPGGNIHLEFDTKEFENSTAPVINISGKKSKNTEFLNSVDFKWRSLNWQEIIHMPVDSFIQFTRNLQKETSEELKNLERNNFPSKKFVEIAKLRFDVMLVSGIEYYEKKSQQKNKSQISDLLTDLTENIPLDDTEKCREINEYKYYLIPHYQDLISNKMKESGLNEETSAYINKMADEIIALNAPQTVKDDVAKWYFSVFYKRPDSLRKVYIERFYEIVENPGYIKEFKDQAAAIERTKPGAVAPPFSYPDVNGNMISLESFKGKVVYVDVWATWCGPCKSEFPYQNKLETELKGEDIVFVSISIDRKEDKEAWKKMVKEKELGGFQLYAEGDWNSKIAKDYAIKGIPYFIIIDKEGKLVEVFATRPSDPITREKLLKLARS